MLALSRDDYLWFIDDCLDAMVGILDALGDDLACTRPALPGANSPYAILTHCLGMMEWWAGEAVAGRPVPRDRDAEFTATGTVAELVARVAPVRDRFAADVEDVAAAAPTRLGPEQLADYSGTPETATQGGVLMHVFHELAQHRGHLEVTRDLLLAPRGGRRP